MLGQAYVGESVFSLQPAYVGTTIDHLQGFITGGFDDQRMISRQLL